MYLVFVIIRIAPSAGDTVEIKEMPTLTELLVSLQVQVNNISPVLASLSTELSKKDNI